MDLLWVEPDPKPNPRDGRTPFTKISNKYLWNGLSDDFHVTELLCRIMVCTRSNQIGHTLKYFSFYVKSVRNSTKRPSSVETSTPL